MKKYKKILFSSLTLIAVISALTGCSKSENKQSEVKTSKNKVEKVTFGITLDQVPNAYVDENNKPAGQNYEVQKAVDKLLPQYEFNYDPVDAETLLAGIDTGKYAGGIGNYFWNEERAKKYVFPENPISGGVFGLIVNKKFEGKVKTLEDVAKNKLKVVPPSTSSSAFKLYTKYNQSHEDEKIDFTTGEGIDVGESVKFIQEGRYNASIFLKSNYTAVKKQVDPKDETYFAPISGVKTWVIYQKDQKALVKAIDGAMKKLKDNGTLEKISKKYYGEDIYKYSEDATSSKK